MSRKSYALSLLSGMLLVLSFPKYGFAAVAWIALVPLLVILSELRVREAFRAGFLTGFLYNLGVLYWISFVVATYGNGPVYFGVAAMLLLSAFLGLFIALFAGAVVYFRERGIPAMWTAPLLWTSLEFGKSNLFTGFPWENLAYSQHSFLPIIQIGDITGFYGITFLIVLINAIIANLVLQKGSRPALIQAVSGLVLVGLVTGYGLYRMADIRKITRSSESQQVSLIQGNIDQSIKWKPEFQDETLRIYKDETLKETNGKSPALIVWPETATPFYFQDIDDRQREVLSLAKSVGSHILLGSPSYKPGRGPEASLNSAFLVSPEGKIVGQYDKVHLVPFGEYVPLRRVLPFMSKLVAGIGDFHTGEGFRPLQAAGKNFGVLICYEAIFPEISRAYARAGIDFFVNITNDAWFGRTSAPYQHLSMTAFRAVETRRYIIRAANTGISALIRPTGEVESATGLFQRGGLSGQIRLLSLQTIYTRIGDVFAYGCLALLGFAFILSLRRKNHVGRITGENFKSSKQGRVASELSLKSRTRKSK